MPRSIASNSRSQRTASRARQGHPALFRFTFALAVAAAAVLGCQPEDETPGLWLDGEIVTKRVADWRFTNDIEEIFVETGTWYGIPHSTTIWCVEVGGELYIGSYGDEKKAWEKHVSRDPTAKLSISGKLYEVSLAPVSERALIEALDTAYAQKYDMADVFGDEIPEWWYYRASTPR
jgi:hypothetical protein